MEVQESIAHHGAQNGPLQSRIEHIGLEQVGLEVRRAGQDEARHVAFVVRDEELYRHLRALAHVVVSFLEPEAGETQRRLPTSSVLLGKVHCELVQDRACVPLQGRIETAVTVHNNEAEYIIIFKQFIQRLDKSVTLLMGINFRASTYLGMKLVVAEI